MAQDELSNIVKLQTDLLTNQKYDKHVRPVKQTQVNVLFVRFWFDPFTISRFEPSRMICRINLGWIQLGYSFSSLRVDSYIFSY